MNEQDLDRIIDSATADLIGHEPSRTLRHKVIARVRAPESMVSRRFVWATAAAVAILCAVIAIALLNRTAAPLAPDRNVRLEDATVSPHAVSPRALGEPPAQVDQPGRAPESSAPAARRTASRVPRSAFPPNDLLSSIEPITAEPLVLPSIDLPPLENQATSIEGLEIEELTIEPLTASND
jgi:hypothetical protein